VYTIGAVCQGEERPIQPRVGADRALSYTVGYMVTSAPVRDIPGALLEGLNERQMEAVLALDGPVMIVAGPGSGKTTVLIRRVAVLLATGTRPGQVMAVTFTNKAANEMRERLTGLLGEDQVRSLWVATFHSFCVKLLRRYYEAAGLEREFTIADADDSRKIVRGVLKELGLLPDDAKRYAGAISWAKNNLQGPDSVESDMHRLAQVYEAYQSELSRQHLVDFDDLLSRVLVMLRSDDMVRTACQERFGYIMVDEYQDTNRVQYEIVHLLAQNHHNLCVVGDHDQSIYAWRGAFPGAISEFTHDFPETLIVSLDQNYRSTKNVVDVSRSVIAANPAAHRGDLWTSNDPGDPVRVVEVADDRDEATWVANEVRSAEGSSAIIVRTKAQTKQFEVALSARGVAHVVVGTQRFYDRAEIKDALSWLRLVLNPADRASLLRAASSPKRGLGDATLSQLLEVADREGIVPIEVMDHAGLMEEFSTRARNILTKLAQDFSTVRYGAEQSPAAALEAVYALGLRKSLSAEPERVENLSQLVTDAALFVSPANEFDDEVYSADEILGIEVTRAFVESAALSSSTDQSETSGTVPVAVITAHASKGREFDNVYVAGVEENLYPHRLVAEDDAGIEEERRLLFVAASRARSKLTILWCRRRMIFGKWEPTAPSEFIAALPEHVEQISLTLGGSAKGRVLPSYANQGAASRLGTMRSYLARTASDPGKVLVPLAPGVLVRGTKVIHASFGEGTVEQDASEREVRISFSDKSRLLVVALAPLSLV
jgi:DNA helicase-2/ATP-dependent DNA helicase PcrA